MSSPTSHASWCATRSWKVPCSLPYPAMSFTDNCLRPYAYRNRCKKGTPANLGRTVIVSLPSSTLPTHEDARTSTPRTSSRISSFPLRVRSSATSHPRERSIPQSGDPGSGSRLSHSTNWTAIAVIRYRPSLPRLPLVPHLRPVAAPRPPEPSQSPVMAPTPPE